MAEAEETPKKKKPIIPIAMILIVLLGGGFFVMKTRAGKNKPAVALAEKETELEEFLTNTQNQTVYVRAKIAVRLRKDYEETKLKENMGDVRDAVILVLNNTPPTDVTEPAKRKSLKKTLAEAMNMALEPVAAGTKKKHQIHKSEDGASSEDWDSETGPILKVRFLSLATQ